MEDALYQTILNSLQTGSVPTNASTASNWRRLTAKFRVKDANGTSVLYRILNEEEGEVERLVLKKSDLTRVWDEIHNLTHVGRTKT